MRNNTFRLSAQNSLRVTELPSRQNNDKKVLNTFKGGNNLRTQLNKTKIPKKQTLLSKTGQSLFEKQLIKSEEEAMAQEVASLDHFKPPVTRDKTKNLIESVKLRRREKHVDTISRFKEDLEDYKENLNNIYSGLVNDLEQVMAIKESSIQDYLQSMTDSYLLSRQIEIISDIEEQYNNYKIESETKLGDMGESLQKLKERRGDVVANICGQLRQALIEIAFVLEGEAKEIEEKEKKQIQQIEQKYYQQYKSKYQEIVTKQEERSSRVLQKKEAVIKNWREIKEKHELETYKTDADSQQFRRPTTLRSLYDDIIALQSRNHENKMKLLKNLIQEDPDTVSKLNIEKWNEALKKVNDYFDNSFDDLIADFMKTRDQHKQSNRNRLQHFRQRLQYIANHNQEEIQSIINEQIEPLCQRNINEQQKMIQDMTAYVQKHDDRQNKVFGEFSKFIGNIGTQNDKFIKDFTALNQKYEIDKAKILDEDQQLVDKLNEELKELKQQLKEALHHIKLEEIEEKCFEKVDEIQKAYRNCHEQNKLLQETRRPSLEQFMKHYQSKIAQLMMLYSPQRKAQLQQKNKEDAENQATRRLDLEQKKKADEEARLIEQAKAKGGKPPAPAKKDPKKVAAELQERKKAILAEIGTKPIEEFTTQTGSLWLVYKNIQQICESFYKIEEEKKQQEENKEADQKPVEDQENKKALDEPEEAIKDYQGLAVVDMKSFIRIDELIPYLKSLRQKLFDKISEKKQRIINESEEADEEMLEQSLVTLDNRLKAHYSLKGEIESEIFVRRSGEITGHKKKYEKYARTAKQKMDLQTQKFNFLLEKGLECLKNHNTEQKSMKEHIPKCKNLSELQGMFSRTRQNYNSFGLTIKEIYGELDRLSTSEVDVLLQKNEDFIKESKLMDNGGDYSNDQINWYQDMLNEITTQIKDQQIKRKQKYQQLKEHSEKKRKELFDAFEKEYHLTVEELSARDGTGKKYGKPKRIAQEKTRLEMNKCEEAQISIDKMISDIAKEYEKNMMNQFNFTQNPPTLQWRKKLMTVYTCITRYGKHIEAFKVDMKVPEMIRVNYNQDVSECKLTADDEQADKIRRQDELTSLGKLGSQKDERVFMKYIDQIQKIISDESRTIYVGDKAKFLTGNDKIPDFLRAYIKNMKKNAEEFRLSSARDLRESCNKLADLSQCISDLFFRSIETYYLDQITSKKGQFDTQFYNFCTKHAQLRGDHMRRLRPNLKNPKCQQELKGLDSQEQNRNKQYQEHIEKTGQQFKDAHFGSAQKFLNKLLNNYEFLLLYMDSQYLFEDFNMIPGDQVDNKTHLNVQKLMVMKQKGIKIDPTSQRNLKRKWEGFDFTIFNIDNRKYELKKQVEEPPKEKDKKAGKKDSKDPKKQQEPEADPTKTKLIETHKTWRQKSIYESQNKARINFNERYQIILQEVNQELQKDTKTNNSYAIKWRETADLLYLS